jgi:polyisoprenoid-binding protein YceI
MARARPGRLLVWLASAVVAVAVLAVAGAFVYIHFISGPAPAPLSLKTVGEPPAGGQSPAAGQSPAIAPAGDTAALAGSWQVSGGSVVGYRVDEVLAGQNNVAVGRTSTIRGSMTISGSTVTTASFTVQMATIHSDESERDAQFDGRIMDVAAYPTGTLTLTTPISLAPVPAGGVARTYHATANLTLHGHTRAVAFTLAAERTDAGIVVSGSIPVLFADWGIANPSFPPFVTTQNHGELEFLVRFGKAASG